MFLFSLHSPLQSEMLQANSLQLSYVQQLKIEKFSIVEYFQHFAFKNREVANGSFKDLVSIILALANVLSKDFKHFAEFHRKNDYAVSI